LEQITNASHKELRCQWQGTMIRSHLLVDDKDWLAMLSFGVASMVFGFGRDNYS
jgi:hypothetical protein